MNNCILLYRYLKLLVFVGTTCICVVLKTSKITAQQLLNGDFEDHNLSCGINMDNRDFNNSINDIRAFGPQSEVDILSDDCNYDLAVSGDHFAALYVNDGSDEIGFLLSEPLKPNAIYRLAFWDKNGETKTTGLPKVQIGISETIDTFGLLIFDGENTSNFWIERYVEFVAPLPAQYVTVRLVSPSESWVFIDQFRFVCPDVELGNDTTFCVVAGIDLHVEDEFTDVVWNNTSFGNSIIVDTPGVYSVFADDGGACQLTDTIAIQEDENNCQCTLYVPNAFSPNQDQVNDLFSPLTNCDFLDYRLLIMNRWGQRVFETNIHSDAWVGTFQGQNLDAGTYMYLIEYRFAYQQEIQHEAGSVMLIR